MSKEKIAKLSRYAEELRNRLQSPVPPKHEGHPETFRQFLNRELDTVTKKLDTLRMEIGGGK